MRKFLIVAFFAFALLIGTAGAAPAVHAQSSTQNVYNDCIAQGTSPSDCQALVQTYQKDNGIPTTSLGDAGKAFGPIMTWIMSLFAWLVGVAALILDYTVYYTVVKMGSYINSLSAVGVAWTVLRDIGNILLIFGFVAVGITTIIDRGDWYGGGKKMLPMMLMAAIFLNFSLFFAEAIVDTGNLFATQFYKEINGGDMPTAESMSKITVGKFGTNYTGNEGISNAIMGKLGFQTLYNTGNVNSQAYQDGNTWLIGFMGIILFLVTAFVLFSLSFVLIMRFVALVFLLIVAPIGFAGLALPALSGKASQWWNQLFSQTITAPLMLLLLYIALRVITDTSFMTGLCSSGTGTCTGSWDWLLGGGDLAGFASMLLSFLVAIGLLLFVVVVSKSWSAFGGDWATKTAGKLSFGVAGFAGRSTVGWASNRSAKYLRSTWVGRVPVAGTGLVKGFDKVAGANFDLRTPIKNTPVIGNIGAGNAQKGGYKADLKSRTEARVNYAKELKGRELTDEEKMRQAQAQMDIKDLEKEHKKAQAQWGRDDKARNDLLAELETERKEKNLTKEEFEARKKEIDDSMKEADELVKGAKEKLDKRVGQLRALESVTDKGAQRKYATVLNLGLDEKGFFNKYINFAANTDAAKKIRDAAKESKDDKALKSLKEAIKKAGEEETSTAAAAQTATKESSTQEDNASAAEGGGNAAH